MSRLFEARRRRQWESARGLPAGTSAGRPEPVDWGKLVGFALIGGAAYVVLKEQQAKSRARQRGPPGGLSEPVLPASRSNGWPGWSAPTAAQREA